MMSKENVKLAWSVPQIIEINVRLTEAPTQGGGKDQGGHDTFGLQGGGAS